MQHARAHRGEPAGAVAPRALSHPRRLRDRGSRLMPLFGNDVVCQQAVELVTDYLEGALSWRQRRRLERHLKACPHCTEYLREMRITIRAVGRVEPESLSPDARSELVELYR